MLRTAIQTGNRDWANSPAPSTRCWGCDLVAGLSKSRAHVPGTLRPPTPTNAEGKLTWRAGPRNVAAEIEALALSPRYCSVAGATIGFQIAPGRLGILWTVQRIAVQNSGVSQPSTDTRTTAAESCWQSADHGAVGIALAHLPVRVAAFDRLEFSQLCHCVVVLLPGCIELHP